MRKCLSVLALVVGGLAFIGGARADTTLLSLIDPPAQTGTPFDLSFIADASTTTLSVGGYQVPAFEQVQFNGVTTGGGSNLLGGTWTLVPAASGSETSTMSDGTGVPALNFGAFVAGLYDTYSQTFATTPGATYEYAFEFSTQGGPSGLLVTTTGSASVVPEPSTWAMMLIGFAGLGFAGYRRARATVSAA
jgi:PEP-CTERM motif